MTIKKLLPAIVVTAVVAVPATSMAEVSANIGWVSDYLYRGVFQEDSSASAGIDFNSDAGFYLGTWGADVGQGLEYDVYFGISRGDNFTWSVGYTAYRYTDDFDDDYDEINLGIGYGIFALDVAVGEYAGRGSPADYTFTSVTISPEKWPYFKLGSYGDDFESLGEYVEIGYTYTLEEPGIDLSIAVVTGDDVPLTNPADGDIGEWAITFGITKNISIGN